jgi:four helix bundle protein
MPVTRFEELKVWNSARAFNREVYQLTRKREFARDYAMVDQMRRASLSVMNNIAEGFEKYRRNEFLQFLSVSKGSAGEIRSMLYAAFDVGYLDESTFQSMLCEAENLGRAIGTFRSGLERSAPPKVLPGRNGKR